MEINNSQLSTLNSQLIRVAIVDDHVLVVEAIEKFIGESGDVQVHNRAYTAEACRQMLKPELPDVPCLSNCQRLPQQSGLQIAST